MSDPGKAVFLSYASQDTEAAKRIAEALRSAGVEVWFDQSELVSGDAWDHKIRKQIKECALLIPIISQNTQARTEGYFRLEWRLADQRTHLMAKGRPFLLPVVIDDTRDADAHVPESFTEVQWTKFTGEAALPAFVARVKKLLEGHEDGGRDLRTPPPSAKGAGGNPVPQKQLRRGLALGAMVVVGLVLTISRPWQRAATPEKAGTVTTGTRAPTDFPGDPDLRRVYQMLYNVNDGIAEDFALMDDLVNPLLKARPNDAEVVTVAAELAQEFVTRGFDASTARRAQAQRLTERAVQLAPDNPEALAALGYYLYSTGNQLGRAEELLRRAIKLKPGEPRFHCFLYSVLIKARKPPAEIDAFGAQMAAAFPDYPMAAYLIASHYTAVSSFAAGEEWVDKALAQAPLPYAILLKAQYMLEVHGDVPGMEYWLERMPERQRTSAALLNAYAVVATITGRTGSARRVIEATADTWLVDGTYIFPKALLAGELEQLDGHDDIARRQFEAALDEIKTRLAADPTDLRPVRAELWAQLGLGHQAEAHASLRTNLEKRPRPYRWTMNLTWWTSALRGCLVLGERAQALALLKEACAEAPGRRLLRNLFHLDPKMAPFRDDPEIVALLGEPAQAPVTAAAPDKSVAVLAFANLSDDKANEYFSDGITEELLNVLAKVPGLKVTARTSSFFFKGKDVPIPEIAQRLGVAYVVEGSVRKAGDKVRITAQLIKAADGFHVWSDTFTRDLKDVFAVQDEIAGLISKQLSLEMGMQAGPRTANVNPQAFELYVQARQAWNLRTLEGFDQAEELLNRALEIDPNFARAYAALANVWNTRAGVKGLYGSYRERNSPDMVRTQAAIDRAFALDANLDEAFVAQGALETARWKTAEALRSLRRAIELNPGDAPAHQLLGRALFADGRPSEAVAEMKLAAELDPMSHRILDNYSIALRLTGRSAEALAMDDRALALQPTSRQALVWRAVDLAALGRTAEALEQVRRLPADAGYGHFIAQVYMAAGMRAEAEAAVARPGTDRAYGMAVIGRWDEALKELEAGNLSIANASSLMLSPHFDPLRSDPRFARALDRLGLTEAYARAQAWRAAHPQPQPTTKA